MATVLVRQDGVDAFTTLAAALADAGTGNDDTIFIEGAWSIDDTAACTVADSGITIQTDATAKHADRPQEVAGGNTYRHRSASGHSFAVNQTGLIVDGLDIMNESTGTSDEVFRHGHGAASTILVKNSVLGFIAQNEEQDLYYNDQDENRTVTFEQCMLYNVYRGAVSFYDYGDGGPTATININSCNGYKIGHADSIGSYPARTGLAGLHMFDNPTVVLNIKNTIVETGASVPPCASTSATNLTINLEDVASNQAAFTDTNEGTLNAAKVLNSQTFTDTTGSSAFIFEDIDPSPYDLRLQDHANNIAQNKTDVDQVGANLTIPATDISGTSRPQATYYDMGAFEIEAAGAIGLTVANLSHAHNIDASGALTQLHYLSADNLSHLSSLSALALTQEHNISVNGLAHAHTIDAAGALVRIYQLIVNNLAHAHTIDATTLTQLHNLTVAGLDHAHTIDNITLEAAISLVVASLAHAMSIGAISLTQLHNITVDNLAHAHTIDNVTLEYGLTLVVASLAHAMSIGAATLTQEHNLTVNDMAHAMTVDTSALTQLHYLSAAGLDHAMTIDATTLTEAYNLIVANLSHAHTIDATGALSQVHNLLVAGLAHAQTIDGAALTQLHELVVASMAHAHTIDNVVFPSLGLVIDTVIESLSTNRTIDSTTIRRMVSSLTTLREIVEK